MSSKKNIPLSASPQAQGSICLMLNHRFFPACLFIAYFMIPFVVHMDHLLAGESLVSGDGIITLFDLEYLGKSLRKGDFPLWTPYLSCGKPYANAMALGALYPVRWLCSLLPILLQFYAYLGIHYAIGGVFLFLYLKKIDCDAFVSLAVSVIYLFTVHMGGPRKEHTTLVVAALWVPAILFFLESYLRSPRLKWLFLASGAMALQFLGGFLQYVIYSDIFVFFYLLVSGIHRRVPVKRMLGHGSIWLIAYFGFIAVGVLPMAQMMLVLSGSGGTSMDMRTFSALSLHPIKLLMTVFPRIFGDVWAPLSDKNYSSEMDVELLMGAPCLVLLLLGIHLRKKNFYARFASTAGLLIWIYACMGQSDLVTKICFHIPALNLFKIPSRILFLWTLCTIILIAVALNDLYKSLENGKQFHFLNAAVAAGMFIIFAAYALSEEFYEGVAKQPLKTVFLLPFATFLIYLAVTYFCLWMKKSGRASWNTLRIAVVLALVVLTVIQTWPYYQITWNKDIGEILDYPEEIVNDNTKGKFWRLNGEYVVKANQSLSSGVPSLNSYSNYNLPGPYKLMYGATEVPMNRSGLYCIFSSPRRPLREQNDLLSMLGIQYILESPDLDADSLLVVDNYDVVDQSVDVEDAVLNMSEEFQYAMWQVSLDVDSWYAVTLTIEAEKAGERFYVDFYDIGYDSSDQEKWFVLQEGSHEYQAFLPSEDCAAFSNILLRFIAYTDQPLSLSKVSVQKITPHFRSNYQLIAEKDNYRIFENINAKALFYPSQRVEAITKEERENLYRDVTRFDVLNTSYILDGPAGYDFSAADVQVSDIQLHNNRASAQVTTDGDTFINMSQCYYPGWHAYVDGKKTDVYEVNGVIQGTFVPAGEHTVEFRFQPAVFYAGLLVSLLSIGASLLIGRWEGKRKELKR